MKLHYLEIVTADVEVHCAILEKAHAFSFGKPVPELGNARLAKFSDGSLIGVRAPMRDTEEPVARPYISTSDIEDAIDQLSKAGAEIAHPPMELPGYGTFAIYIQGGVQHGLWQM